MPEESDILSPVCEDIRAFVERVILQTTAFVYDLHLELETIKPFGVAFVRKTSWHKGCIQIFWMRFQIISILRGGRVSWSFGRTLKVTAVIGGADTWSLYC